MAGRCRPCSGGPCIGIGREERGHRRPRRRRRLRCAEQLYRARTHTHRVRAAAVTQNRPGAKNRAGTFCIRTRKDNRLRKIRFVAVTIALVTSGGVAFAEDAVDPTAVKSDNGKHLDKEGNPTFKVASDGTVDWYTYSGYRRYHSECHVCHGPDGEGSTYAPGLKDSLKTMNYGDFLGIVASGRKNVTTSQENVMPAFGDNVNVSCYMDDIFVYLRARANDAWGRQRPAKREPKPEAYTKAEEAC